jgi:hypothetical protein
LNRLVLRESCLADFFLSKGISFEGCGERVLAVGGGVAGFEELRTGEGGAGDGVVEGFGLGFGRGRGGQGGSGFAGAAGFGEERDFVGNAAAEIGEGFANVGGVVVGFVLVLLATDQISWDEVSMWGLYAYVTSRIF